MKKAPCRLYLNADGSIGPRQTTETSTLFIAEGRLLAEREVARLDIAEYFEDHLEESGPGGLAGVVVRDDVNRSPATVFASSLPADAAERARDGIGLEKSRLTDAGVDRAAIAGVETERARTEKREGKKRSDDNRDQPKE